MGAHVRSWAWLSVVKQEARNAGVKGTRFTRTASLGQVMPDHVQWIKENLKNLKLRHIPCAAEEPAT